MGRSSGLLFGGALLCLLGLVGAASPVFMTHQTRDVARVGDLKVQTTNEQAHFVPPLVSGGALALGVLLLGAGFYRGA
jgi:hypothetical protein